MDFLKEYENYFLESHHLLRFVKIHLTERHLKLIQIFHYITALNLITQVQNAIYIYPDDRFSSTVKAPM